VRETNTQEVTLNRDKDREKARYNKEIQYLYDILFDITVEITFHSSISRRETASQIDFANRLIALYSALASALGETIRKVAAFNRRSFAAHHMLIFLNNIYKSGKFLRSLFSYSPSLSLSPSFSFSLPLGPYGAALIR